MISPRVIAGSVALAALGGPAVAQIDPMAELQRDMQQVEAARQGVLAGAAQDPAVQQAYQQYLAGGGWVDYASFVQWHAQTVGGTNQAAWNAGQQGRNQRYAEDLARFGDQPNNLGYPSGFTADSRGAVMQGAEIVRHGAYCYYYGGPSHGSRAHCPGE